MFTKEDLFVNLHDYDVVISKQGHVSVLLDDDFYYRFSIDENGNYYLLDEKKDDGLYLTKILESQTSFERYTYEGFIFSKDDLLNRTMLGEDGNIYYAGDERLNQLYQLFEWIDRIL